MNTMKSYIDNVISEVLFYIQIYRLLIPEPVHTVLLGALKMHDMKMTDQVAGHEIATETK